MIVSHGCYLQAGNGTEIGEGTSWAPKAAIISANHDADEKGRSWADSLPVRTGRNRWIGANAVILPGVVIGDISAIGTGSIVTEV
jgi:acetyltransferase-like isoleucine patch superfamily enzyme